MTPTPTISITGVVTNVNMIQISGTNSYTFVWDTSSGTLSSGTYFATVSGTNVVGKPYQAGTQSLTFTIDDTQPITTLSDTDDDNLLALTDTVTITAAFSEAMSSSPKISITGVVTNVAMSKISGTNSYTYAWDTSSGTLSDGIYTATVSGVDIAGNIYLGGTDSITFTLIPTSTFRLYYLIMIVII